MPCIADRYWRVEFPTFKKFWLIIKSIYVEFAWEQFHKKCSWTLWSVRCASVRWTLWSVRLLPLPVPHRPGANEFKSPGWFLIALCEQKIQLPGEISVSMRCLCTLSLMTTFCMLWTHHTHVGYWILRCVTLMTPFWTRMEKSKLVIMEYGSMLTESGVRGTTSSNDKNKSRLRLICDSDRKSLLSTDILWHGFKYPGDIRFSLTDHGLVSSNTIWHHWTSTWSTLVQVMSFCLTAPNHCLNQWLTNHQGGLEAFTWGQFHKKCSRQLIKSSIQIWFWKVLV